MLRLFDVCPELLLTKRYCIRYKLEKVGEEKYEAKCIQAFPRSRHENPGM